jgi:uncharacterized protein (TIGR03437 family)
MKSFRSSRDQWPLGCAHLRWLMSALILLTAIWAGHNRLIAHSSSSQTPAVTVSAASFETTALAPGSIAAAFGVSLATRVEAAASQPLPTTLAGTTVRIRDSAGVERLTQLFFVAPNQVNCLIPPETATGAGVITVRSGDGTVSTGSLEIKSAAPAIFTANSDGQGVPAAVLLRVKSGGQQITEPLAQFDSALNRFKPKPIDFGPEGERVFLILFLTGISRTPDPNNDGNRNESVHLLIGGAESVPAFAGAQGSFAGLDQMNAELPRNLIGRGRLTLSINAPGAASNLVEIEAGPPSGNAPPSISGFSAPTVLAGQMLDVQGNGFSPAVENNLVRIGGKEARVAAAAATLLSVIVPFGVESGPVTVRTNQGEGASANPLGVRTSISGLVESTGRQPIPGVRLRLTGTAISATTGAEGGFLLPDVPAGPSLVEVDASTVPTSPPYPKITLKITALGNRDNQFQRPIALQQPTGPGLTVGSGGFAESSAPAGSVQTGGVIFDVPDNATAQFPDGSTRGVITLTLVENNRTPAPLPAGHFSSTIAQLTPFGARLTPGGKLTFPNNDGFPAGARVTVFRLDQNVNSPALGSFIPSGEAVVTGDGRQIETSTGAIAETSYYFVSLARPSTTVIGRVVESDGVTPVRSALVRSRGQEAFTDGAGGFTLRDVPVNAANDSLAVEGSFVRPNGRVDRVLRGGIAAITGGITQVSPPLALPAATSNRPPVILAPSSLVVTQGETRDVNVVVSDPDQGQSISTMASVGVAFARIIGTTTQGLFVLRITPGPNDAGNYTMFITASDNAGGSTTQNAALRVNRAPVANAQTVSLSAGSARSITLTATDGDNDPLRFTIVSQPARGILSGAAPNLVYAPSTGFSGVDRFTFKVNDGVVDSATQTVIINVTPTIASISPPAAQINSQIQINGAGFAQTAAGNIALFGSISAQVVSSNQAGTQLTVVVPQSLTLNTAPVTVMANSQTSNAVNFYLVNPGANLLRNGDTEEGPFTTTGLQVVAIPGWTTTSNFTAPVYGIPGCMSSAEGQRVGGGRGYMVGGPNTAQSTATQTVSVANFSTDIDAGRRVAVLQALLSGFETDTATARVEFLNSSGAVLGSFSIGPVSGARATFQLRTGVSQILPGTRNIRVTLIATRGTNDTYNDGYFDNVILGINPN